MENWSPNLNCKVWWFHAIVSFLLGGCGLVSEFAHHLLHVTLRNLKWLLLGVWSRRRIPENMNQFGEWQRIPRSIFIIAQLILLSYASTGHLNLMRCEHLQLRFNCPMSMSKFCLIQERGYDSNLLCSSIIKISAWHGDFNYVTLFELRVLGSNLADRIWRKTRQAWAVTCLTIKLPNGKLAFNNVWLLWKSDLFKLGAIKSNQAVWIDIRVEIPVRLGNLLAYSDNISTKPGRDRCPVPQNQAKMSLNQ